jgi:polyribonucleotide 5'-hydroxyl-kinase
MADMNEQAALSEPKRWDLEPEAEYRFELDPGKTLVITLLHGQAEVFGAELIEGKQHLFGGECKAAVFTWKGCTIEVTGEPSTEYVSEETPMAAYGNMHLIFEQMRVRALAQVHGSPVPESRTNVSSSPPRILVLGPENSGKTTVCKILANYTARAGQDWTPVLVNTDGSEGGWAVPGSISAAPITSPIITSTATLPLGASASSAPTLLPSNALLPLVYYYGHADIQRNHLLLERIIRNLGENIRERFEIDAEAQCSGLIVDTPSSFAAGPANTSEMRHKLIKSCVDAFGINVLLVVGHEKLNVEMQRAYGSQLTVVKIPKSGGVVDIDHSTRERIKNSQLHTYFYGQAITPPPGVSSSAILGGESLADLVLSPASITVSFDELSIYQIGEKTLAPSSALPVGALRTVSEMQPIVVDPSRPGSGLLNSVLALLAPFNPDPNERYDEEILDLPVVGFLIVTNLDIPNKKMTILSPSPISFAGRTAIRGSIEWQEQ